MRPCGPAARRCPAARGRCPLLLPRGAVPRPLPLGVGFEQLTPGPVPSQVIGIMCFLAQTGHALLLPDLDPTFPGRDLGSNVLGVAFLGQTVGQSPRAETQRLQNLAHRVTDDFDRLAVHLGARTEQRAGEADPDPAPGHLRGQHVPRVLAREQLYRGLRGIVTEPGQQLPGGGVLLQQSRATASMCRRAGSVPCAGHDRELLLADADEVEVDQHPGTGQLSHRACGSCAPVMLGTRRRRRKVRRPLLGATGANAVEGDEDFLFDTAAVQPQAVGDRGHRRRPGLDTGGSRRPR